MELLSEHQVAEVEKRVTSVLSVRSLADDLLDHFCCYIEAQMQGGKSFEEAFAQAYASISPNGTEEIENERLFLLTFNQRKNMKKLFYSLGFVAVFCISTGMLLRHLHLQDYSGGFMLVGNLTLLLGVLPLIAYVGIQTANALSSFEKVRIVTGVISGALICTGMSFKVLHYPGANMLFVVGMLLFNAVFLPMFFYQLYKRSLSA